jgi:hypothetical protein
MFGLFFENELIKISSDEEKLQNLLKTTIAEHNAKQQCELEMFDVEEFTIKNIDHMII